MSDLLKEVTEIWLKHKLAKRAFVIDDEWEQRETPDVGAWEEFVQIVSVETKSFAMLVASLQSKGFDLASAAPAETINQIFVELGDVVTPAMSVAKENYLKSSHVLQRLEVMLKELEFEVESFSAPPDFGK